MTKYKNQDNKVVKKAKKLGVKFEEEPCNVAIGMSSLLATTTGCSSNALGRSSQTEIEKPLK